MDWIDSWYNYDTQDYESEPMDTDDIALRRLPQGIARELYKTHRMTGLDILHAYAETMESVTGVERHGD
jgi:hypothetical protein